MKTKSKKLAKANYGMAITGDKNKTFVGTGTQPRWTEDSVKRSKSKYPQFSKEIDEAFTNQTKRDQAKADAEIARANAAKKEELTKQTSNMKTMQTGGVNNPNKPAKASPTSGAKSVPYKSGGSIVKKGSPENKAGRGLMGSAKKGGTMNKAMYGKSMMKKSGTKKK